MITADVLYTLIQSHLPPSFFLFPQNRHTTELRPFVSHFINTAYPIALLYQVRNSEQLTSFGEPPSKIFFVKIEHFCLNLQIISPTFPPTNVLFEFSHNSGHATNYHPIRYKTSFYLGLLQNGFNTQILYLQLHFLEPPKGQKYDNSEWTFYFQSFTFGVHEKHTD